MTAPKRRWLLVTGTLIGALLGGILVPGLDDLTTMEAVGILCFAATGLLTGLLVDFSI